MLDHTLFIWTNELGKGNSHTLERHPLPAGRRRLGFQDGPLAQVQEGAAQPAAHRAGQRRGPRHHHLRQPETLRRRAADGVDLVPGSRSEVRNQTNTAMQRSGGLPPKQQPPPSFPRTQALPGRALSLRLCPTCRPIYRPSSVLGPCFSDALARVHVRVSSFPNLPISPSPCLPVSLSPGLPLSPLPRSLCARCIPIPSGSQTRRVADPPWWGEEG